MRFVLTKRELITPWGTAAGHVKRRLGIAHDYVASVGTPVYMPWNGKIFQWFGSKFDPGGYWVGFKDKDGNTIQLAHLSARLILPGTTVNEGTVIARTGNTGTNTSGPHLHLQIIAPNGKRIDPANYNWGSAPMPPGGEPVTQDQKDREKFFGLWQAGTGNYPDQQGVNIPAELSHIAAIKQAHLANGASFAKADSEQWRQYTLEKIQQGTFRF